MIKLVVSDFDGTLLPYGEKSVSEATVQYIKKLIRLGVKFAVASGRTYSELVSLLPTLADEMYFICNDGSLIIHKNKILFKKQFSKGILPYFFDADIFKGAMLYSLGKVYTIGDVKGLQSYGKTPVKATRHFEINDDVYKISANLRSFELVDTKDYRVHYSDGYMAEFVSPYANKGVALNNLQLHLGIQTFDTVVMGDADNDVAMTAFAKESWAIGNKSKELKSRSTNSHESAQAVLCKIVDRF